MMAPNLRNSAAPTASVLLILAAILAVARNTSMGLPVAVVSRSVYSPGTLCVEQRLIIVRIASDHRLYINSEPIMRAELTGRLKQIFGTRAEPTAFILGAPELTYGEVADVVARVRLAVRSVGLLTPATVPTVNEPLLRASYAYSRWNYPSTAQGTAILLSYAAGCARPAPGTRA
jgi:biopolymer transport protein ExbD